jgi:hypothetical protein
MSDGRDVPTCEYGFWEPLHDGCPACGPDGPCRDPEYEAIIQAHAADELWRKTLLVVCAFVLLIVALAGCTTVRYQRVYCLTVEQLAELKAQRPDAIRDKLTGKADEDIRTVTGKLVRVQAWGDGLLDVLGSCVKG